MLTIPDESKLPLLKKLVTTLSTPGKVRVGYRLPDGVALEFIFGSAMSAFPSTVKVYVNGVKVLSWVVWGNECLVTTQLNGRMTYSMATGKVEVDKVNSLFSTAEDRTFAEDVCGLVTSASVRSLMKSKSWSSIKFNGVPDGLDSDDLGLVRVSTPGLGTVNIFMHFDGHFVSSGSLYVNGVHLFDITGNEDLAKYSVPSGEPRWKSYRVNPRLGLKSAIHGEGIGVLGPELADFLDRLAQLSR